MELRPATTRTALVVDAAVAAAFSVLALLELRLHWDDGYSYGSPAWNIPLLLAVTVPVAWRRRAPGAALAVAFGAVVVPSLFVAHTLFFFGGLLPLALLVYSAARQLDRYALAVLAGAVALLAVYPLRVPPFDAGDYAFGAVLFGAAWGAGRLVRRLERQRLLLADALAAAQREQAARERALLLDERARIARELHDVVAHAVSVMVVQAGAARFALGTDEDEVRERLLSVEETGRSAVGDLRRLLDLLRADDDHADDDDPSGPQPGLDRLGDLVDGLQRAGLPVRVEIDGETTGLPAALDVTAYRVLQEALTNVLKHAAGEWVLVRVRVTGDAVVLEVTDGGPARAGGLSSGHGLVGMRERVALFGGRLEAGPENGGWSVRAELPLEAAGVEATR
ncbi:MAG: sensor histidine kinase [Blastococcus sp.]